MSRPYKPTIPATFGEIDDLLAWMLFEAPKFQRQIYQVGDIEGVFFELKEGLALLRSKLGEERYSTLVDMADQARTLFEADPEDEIGQTNEGRKLIIQMEKTLNARRGGQAPPPLLPSS